MISQELNWGFKMTLAIITDSSVSLPEGYDKRKDFFILDIPIIIDQESYVEGKNLSIVDFYEKMRQANDFPKTSQPSLAELDALLADLEKKGYKQVLGLFLSSGISGFYQNIQYLTTEYPDLEIVFPDTKITSVPLGLMVKNALDWRDLGWDFSKIVSAIEEQIEKTTAFIMVDDLDHLVKGGRLSNGAALLGNLLSIKPILYFKDGKIEVYEKVRTEKKAIKRLMEILDNITADGTYDIAIIHSNAEDKAETFRELLAKEGRDNVSVTPFSAVIATHLGEGAVAFGISPVIEK